MTQQNRKLCDRCGEKPFVYFEQDENKYELICEDCSRKSRRRSCPEQLIELDPDFSIET
jgi:formylmethanofuran dehydrogenase subunit E